MIMKINKDTNNSSALIAPSRSEIRIELPHVTVPSWKDVLQKVCSAYPKISHKVSLCSALALSSMCVFEIKVPMPLMILLGTVAYFSSCISFHLIYSETSKEEESVWAD